MGTFFKLITTSLCVLTVFSVFPVFSTGVASAQDASIVQNKLKHLSKVNPLTKVSVLSDPLSQTKTYISPNLDTTSSNDVNVIVQFNREPAAVGRYNAKNGKQSINLDSSESTILSEHSSFKNSARVQGLNTRVKREFTNVLNGMEVTIPANQINKLASLPGVKSIYENETFYPLDLSLADETRLVPQNVLKPSQATTATISDTVNTVTPTFDSIPLDQIHARDAWNSGFTGAGLKVGVLDTGIDYLHPDLKDAYKGGYDIVNQDNDPYEDLPDPNTNFPGTEHGTHVAGTIAGRAANTGSSIVQKGVAYNVNLYAYKVLGRVGSTTNVSGSTAQIIDGIEHAVKDGMDVINMSLGNNAEKNPNSPEAIAVNNAVLSGVVVVIANGNAASNTAYSYTAGSPASSQLGIAVGAVDSQTERYSGSATSSFDSQHAFTLNAMAWTAQQHDFSTILGTNPLDAVYVGLGASADYNGKNVLGKVVLVSRGQLAFVDKIANAKTNGAKAVIIFNGNVKVNTADPDLSASIPGRDEFIGVVLGDGFDYIPTFDMEGMRGRALAAKVSADPTKPLTFNFGASYTQSNVAGDHMASFSSRGPGLDGNYDVKPDFVAPGVNVWSTMPEYKKVNSTATYNNAYIRLSGTSMATPHVTGAALLIKQAHPTWTPFDIRAAISNTADETVDQNGVLNDIYSQGSGRINVLKAIQTPALLESLSHLTILDSNLIPQDVIGYDGNVSFGLVAAGSNSKTELLQVKNTSNQAQTYHASVQMHSNFTTDPVLHTTVPNASKIVPSLTGISSSNDITVAASAIQQLNLQLAVATDADEGVYEGEVTLTSTGLPSLHLPFVVHVGSTVPDANLGFQQLSISNPVLTPAKNKTDVSFRLTAKDVNIIFFDVFDLDNKYIGYLDYYVIPDTNNKWQMIPPGNHSFLNIPGTYYDNNGTPKQLPDGKYTLQVSGFNDSNYNIFYSVSGNLGVDSSSSTVTDLTEARAQFKTNIANTAILNQKVLALPTSVGFTYSVTNSSMPSLIDSSGTLLALPLSGHTSVTLQVKIALAADPSKFTTVDVDVNLSTLPTVAGVNPANQAIIYTSMPVITAYVDDADTGIDSNSIAVKINGFTVPSVYNPAYKTVTAIANHLPKGSYLLTIDASNKAGNKAQQWSSTFKVDVNNTAGKVRYLALGDSLAAGWTPSKSIGVGYTDMLAEHIHRVDFLGEFIKNFAYPRYTTQDVLDNIRNNVTDPNGVTIQDNIANAGVITLDAGANDFLEKLDANFSMDPNKVPALLTQIGQNTGSIILEIRRLNPTVPIYIMGYYDAFHNFPLPDIQKQQLSDLLDRLNQTLASAAQQTGAVFVPTKNAIAADYPNNLPNPLDIHPSPKGYAAIADALWNVMQSQFVWPQGSSLTAANVAATSLTLNWTPANGGVTAYKIYQGTNELGTVAGNVYAFDVAALLPDTTYSFKVEAKLPNGTWTKDGPAVTQKTTAAPDITAPVIGSVTPADGTTVTTATPLISAVLTETGSGIDPASIVVKVDNQTLQTSYNAVNATVTAATYSFANGSHALTINVTDLAGNHALQWSSSFTVNVNSSSGYTGGGGGGGSPLPAINQLSVNDLKDHIQKSGTSTSLIIDLKKDTYILLPSNIGELLQLAQKKVSFLSDGKSIEIPASVLISLAKLISGDAATDAQIRVTLKAIESTDTSSLVDAANQTSGATIKQNGTLYEFDLTIETKDGKTSRLDHFSEPITIRFTLVSDGTNKGLLGIYYLNELLKQWEYIGGTLNRENGTFEAHLSHNSKYAVLEYTKTYSDVPSGHWAFNTIQALSAKHVIEGVSNQEFGPAQLTTRGQFVTLLVRALGIQRSEGQSAFIDVAQGQWYSDAITTAVRAGIVKGMDDSHFAPNATITREQMAVMLVRAYEYKKGSLLKSSNELTTYQDAQNVSSWANSDVNKAINAGLMQGRDEGRFVPEATTTRAETAKAIYNLLDK